MELLVLIPDPSSRVAEMITRGSAIVGENKEGRVPVCFEGNVYKAANLNRFVERLLVAGSRYEDRAPTIARTELGLNDILVVGTWETEARKFRSANPVAQTWLERWLGYVPTSNEFQL